VQWLNARAGDPDILQLDVVWTAEFAAAGWVLPLDRFTPPVADFFPATIEANRWGTRLFALPWFVDVGLLYWRTDLLDEPPATMEELVRLASACRADTRQTASATGSQCPGDSRIGPSGERRHPPFGIVWQGARYEGLVTVFVEYLGAFGGRILDDGGRAVVDSPEAVRALAFMRDQLYRYGVAPREVLTWHEEETRFAFQNGNAVFMRNWPYAAGLLGDSSVSRVAGRFSIAPMPAAEGGTPTATLGGAQLAINAHSEMPEAAYALIAFLTAPEQMLERAEVVKQYPTRHAVYDDPRLARALDVPVDQVRAAVTSATPRPVIPIYTQLSELLQIQLHRALVRQVSPEAALGIAARQMNELMERTRVREAAAP
jgi:multiple sugar transport system substrate-binding protein